MTVFQLIQFVKHKLLAKDRHGIHSPFVYEFNENIVNRLQLNTARYNDGFSIYFSSILKKILQYYNLNDFEFDCFSNYVTYNSKDKSTLEVNASSIEYEFDRIVLYDDIHKNNRQYQEWLNSTKNLENAVIIDLYKVGVVFISKRFKVSQNFKIRYK
jgi:hypothetical protein